MPKLILVGGGARSGKSRFALDYARRLGSRRRFVATARAVDAEMAERIARHRWERGADFVTDEEPLELPSVLAQAHGDDAEVVVVDCLTLWLANLLAQDQPAIAAPSGVANEVAAQVDRLLAAVAPRRQHVILVSNEVGLGLVPETPLGRSFRDIAGRAHQAIAAQADEVYLAVMGLVIRLLPDPVRTFRPGEVP